jgi:hypothetical protein
MGVERKNLRAREILGSSSPSLCESKDKASLERRLFELKFRG